MICTVCETRFAPFPPEDFEITSSRVFPKNPQAREKRSQIFESDEPGICGPECQEILDAQLGCTVRR